ncbi:hypothetical protein [Ethanoligenens sp.]|uniref:hypothetical protein n=1 Tax=Ethanoligenens sp. TaxID=2099655 RepID=UPI0039E80B07
MKNEFTVMFMDEANYNFGFIESGNIVDADTNEIIATYQIGAKITDNTLFFSTADKAKHYIQNRIAEHPGTSKMQFMVIQIHSMPQFIKPRQA